MLDIFQREFVYLWYYCEVITRQIAPYWIIGIIIGSAISVFGKNKINQFFATTQKHKLGLLGIIPATIIGIISPLCMYGTIPIVASFAKKGMREDWLGSFLVSSVLLNPQLMIYTAVLGKELFFVRIFSAFICGISAGLFIKFFYNNKNFFNFSKFNATNKNKDTHSNLLIRYFKNVGRNIRATFSYFLLGIFLTALFQRYVPDEVITDLFGDNGFGVLMAATLGVPLYACGGGTIPLIAEWLKSGMSYGAASAFMITGPATKFTNLGAVKIILGNKNFILYLTFIMLYSFILGMLVNIIF